MADMVEEVSNHIKINGSAQIVFGHNSHVGNAQPLNSQKAKSSVWANWSFTDTGEIAIWLVLPHIMVLWQQHRNGEQKWKRKP